MIQPAYLPDETSLRWAFGKMRGDDRRWNPFLLTMHPPPAPPRKGIMQIIDRIEEIHCQLAIF
jgi:hypothetical protein